MDYNDDFHTERELVWAAASNSDARACLRQLVRTHVATAAKQLTKLHGLAPELENSIVEVGMGPFEAALHAYLKNGRTIEQREGHFLDYYTWWMRQSISEYLKRRGGSENCKRGP